MNLIKRHSLLIGTRHCPMNVWMKLAAYACAALTVTVGTVMLIQPTDTELKLSLAKRQIAELENILNGKLQMIDVEGRYARVATVKWQTVELVK